MMKKTLQIVALVLSMAFASTLMAQTDCSNYVSIPYSHDFEGISTGGLPPCWTAPVTGVNGSNTFPSVYVYSNNTRNGSGYFEFEASSSSSNFEIAVLPLMQNLSELKLVLWVSNSSDLPGKLEVGVWEDDSVFVPVDTLNIVRFSGTNNWKQNYHQFVVYFNEYYGSGERIALRASRANAGQQYTVFVDDLSVESAVLPEVTLPATAATNINTDLVINATYGGSTSGLYYSWTSTMYDAGNAVMTYIDDVLTINYSIAGTDTVSVIATNAYGSDTATMIVRALDLSPVTEFPYSTGFEAGDDANWQFANSTTNAWHIGTAAANGGTTGMYISNDAGVTNAYTNNTTSISYAYRPLQLSDPGEYAFSFDWRGYGESNWDYLRVWLAPASFEFTAGQLPNGSTSTSGYTTTTPSGWIDLGNGKLNQQNTWQTKSGTFMLTAAGSYNLVFMWCNDGSSGTNPPTAIDNVAFAPLTCPSVINIALDSAAEDELQFHWQPMGTESQWEVSVGDSLVDYATDTFYTATYLNSNTLYNIRVRPICDAGDTGLAATATFRTTCGTMSIPFFDDFDSYANGQFPPCWQRIRAHGTDPSVNAQFHHSGSQSMFLLALSDTTLFCTPSAVPLDGNMIKVTYYAYMGYSSYMNYVMWIKAGVMTNPNDLSTFIPLDSVGYHNFNNVFEEREFNTASLDPSAQYYVAWMYYSNNSSYRGAVDDVSIVENTGCNRPQTASIDNVGARTATFSWPSVVGASGYTVTYSTVNNPSDPSALTSSTFSGSDTSLTITGLQPTTHYYAWVATDCSSSEQSDQRSIGSFTTLVSCPAVTNLTVDTTTIDGATISWTAGDVETQWYVTLDSTVIGIVNDTFYTATGLLPLTGHTLYVRAYCDVDDTSLSANIAFVTRCADATCNMTLNMTDSYGDGWNGNAIQIYQAGVLVGEGTIPSGTSNTETIEVCSSAPAELRFVLGSYASEMGGTVTDGAGLTVFTIANMGNYSTGSVLATVTNPCPDCIPPMDLTLSASDSVSLTFTWNADPTASGFLVTFDGTTQVVTTNSFTATGLNANTLYNISVSTLCVIGDTSNAVTASGRTGCGVVAIPYTTGFEGYSNGDVPSCWQQVQTGSSGSGTFPSVYNHTNAYTGGAYFEFESNSGQTEIAALPEMANISSLMLTFYASLMNHNFVLEAGVMEGSTFVPVDTLSGLVVGSGGNWHGSYHEYDVAFSNYTGTGNRIALRVTGTGSYTLMLDDLSVSVNTGCPRPDFPTVTTVLSDQIGLSLSGSSTGDYMLYISDGAGYVDSASVTGANSYTFTGLSPVTTYTIDVHADCGSAISSPRTVTATTTLVADSLPYSTGFETTDDVAWMLLNGTATNKWYIDSAVANAGSQSLYISNDNGVSNTYTNSSTSYALAYKLFQFDSIGDYAISYDWRADGESSYDYIRVALVPGTYEFQANASNGISTTTLPSGWIALDGGSKLNLSSSWQNHSEVFSLSTASNYYVLFFWRNDGTSGNNPPAAIDNVQISRLSCPTPQNLTLTNATTSTIQFGWTPAGSESQWEVTFNGVTTIETTPSYVATGLASSTTYSVSVRAVCAPGDTSFAVNGSFRTTCGEITSFPWVEDFEAAGVLDCWDQEGSGTWTTGTGDYSSSTGAHDGNMNARCTHSSTGYATKLITPVLALSAGSPATLSFWHIQRSWAGDIDSLVVYYRSSMSDSWHRLAGYSGAISSWTKDSVDLPNTSATYQICFEMYDGYGYGVAIDDVTVQGASGGCSAPVVSNVVADVESVTVTFVAVSPVELSIAQGNVGNPPATTTVVTGSSYTFTGLTPSTLYTVFLRQHCTDSTVSDWTSTTATTEDLGCVPPTNLELVGTGYTSVTLGWTQGNDEVAWQVRVFNNTYDSIYTVSTNPVVISGLIPAVTYNVVIRSLCGSNNDLPGEWGEDTVTFTTDICPDVEGLVVSNLTSSSADISWNPTTGVSGYSLLWFMEDAELGNATVQNPTYHLDGLEAEMPYRVLVKNICAPGAMSEHWASTEFVTPAGSEGIDEVAGALLSIYPNPASTAVTVSLDGFGSDAKVEIVDMNGRTVAQKTAFGTHLTIDLTGMASGAYFVRVTGSSATAVARLLVR